MRIGISFFNSIVGGPRSVTINILKNIDYRSLNFEFIIFTDVLDDLQFLDKFDNVKIVLIKKISKYDLLLWEQIFVWYYAKKYKIDVFHGTKNSVPFLGKFKKICTIHDLAYYILPETFSFFQRVHLKISAYIAKIASNKIVAVSNNTKKDINSLLNVDSCAVEVIYNGVDEIFFQKPDDKYLNSVLNKYNLPKKFFLHVGTIQPRKNIKKIIDAFVKFKKQDNDDFYLVLAGRKGWYYKELLSYIDNLEEVKRYIKFIGMVDDNELVALYYLSYIFIYASNYDGFGLVPLEAMATGTPAIVSNVSSLPEVVGDCAIMVNQNDVDSIYKAMVDLVFDNDKYRTLCIKSIEQAKKFSWKNSAEQYVNLYKRLGKK